MQFNEDIIRVPNLDDVIERFPLTISADSYVVEAIVLMSQALNNNTLTGSSIIYKQVASCVLVIKEGQVLGIFTQSDIVRFITVEMDLSKVKISEVMSFPVVTLKEVDFQDILTALLLLGKSRISHLPIINDEEQLVGIVTEKSLLQAFDLAKIREFAEDLQQYLQINQQLQKTLEELQAAEDELRQQNEALIVAHERAELEQQRYQDLFEFAPNGYLVTNVAGKILEANYAAATLLSVEQNYLIGKPLIVFIAQPDRQTFINQLTNLQHIQEWEINLQPRRGKSFPASMRVAAIASAQGQLIGWRCLVRDITDRKAVEAKLLYDAFHDPLTGLPNRGLLINRLTEAIEQRKLNENYLFALLFLDLDGFKFINDSLGHNAGDQLLIAFGVRLKDCLSSRDTLARLGGDEFALLLEPLTDISDATAVAQCIQKKLASPFNLSGQEVFITTSIGIVLSNDNYVLPNEILRDADTAMYRAKSLGKRRYEIFEPAMRTQILSRLQMENDLHRAVENNNFQIYYQPIIKLETGKITGFEALVRWLHSSEGFVSPRLFIPIAEETGLIVSLNYWILRNACEQLHIWQASSSENSLLTISVNLSMKQFLQTDFIEQIKKILQDTSVAASNLILEITESMLMGNDESITEKFVQLRSLGVNLCIDNFGIGYSSLGRLHRLPINMLKIDRSFVSGIGINEGNLEITEMITTLAQQLNMNVTAEGVETKEQLASLRQLNCNYGQGYVFSPALDSVAATALTLTNPTW